MMVTGILQYNGAATGGGSCWRTTHIQEEHCQTLNIIIRQGWFFMAVYIERTFLGVVRIVLMGVPMLVVLSAMCV